MKNRELKEYLSTFPEDSEVDFLLANPRKRKLYGFEKCFAITDCENLIFCIDVGEETDMDAECRKACEESETLEGQMEIEDFPEVMP